MIYAIGDIHGNFDLLYQLYQIILEDIRKNNNPKNKIVFLGDYIDRGPQNRDVVNFLMDLRDTEFLQHIFLWGNHEEMFIEAMDNQLKGLSVRIWLNSGGDAWLDELGMDWDYFRITFPWHKYSNWFKTHLVYYHETEDYVFVHGGLDIEQPNMSRQDKQWLIWARFMQPNHYAKFPKVVIHGHTPVAEPLVDKNRINVDTSLSRAEHGHLTLTAVALPNRWDGQPRFLQASRKP